MKKLTRLLALVLAAVMLLSCGAFAANGDEEEEKQLWVQFLDWETNEPVPDDVPHPGSLRGSLDDEFHVAVFTSDNHGEKLTPVPAEKLEADEGLIIYGLCPGERGKEHYAAVRLNEWDKEYTISYKGYSMLVESMLPPLGFYSAPEATIDNYLRNWGAISYSPVAERRTVYLISTDTDENAGRHLEKLEISRDCENKDSFKLEKVNDDVYKLTLTDDIDAPEYHILMDITWRQVKFLGGGTIKERFDGAATSRNSLLYSEKEVFMYDQENLPLYNDVKADYSNKLTLKAGESKDIYVAFTFFHWDRNAWVMGNFGGLNILSSDSNLKVKDYFTDDLERGDTDAFKLTVSCDKPGAYILNANTAYPEIRALYHENGKQYTNAEFQKWMDNTPIDYIDGELVVYTDDTYKEYVPFEKAFPGQKIVYYIEPNEFAPITVTVEAAELPFPDVEEGVWYTPAINFVYNKSYMTGYDDGNFWPDNSITGAQFAQILYNIAGKPAAAEGASFAGVTNEWYAPAILWAAGEGIVTDSGEAALGLDDPLPRQQMALMLYNYLDKPEGKGDLSVFSDADKLSDWAKPAMEWAVSAKVFQGNDDGTLNPTGSSTRAQVAQVLMNYFG